MTALGARARDLDALLAGLLEAVRQGAPTLDEVTVLLREGSHLRARASTREAVPRVGVGEGCEGLAAARCEVIDAREGEGARLAVPLVVGGESVAVLRVSAPAPIDAATRAFVCAVAARAAASVALHAKRLESARRARMGAAVSTLGHLALTSPSLDVLLSHALDAVVDAIEVPYVAVVERQAGGEYVMRAVRGWPVETLGMSYARDDTGYQVSYTITTDATVVTADLDVEARFDPSPARIFAPVRSSVSLPIRLGPGEPYGVLVAHATETEVFTEDRVAFVEAVANVLGATLARDRETARLREREAFLRLTTDAAALGTWDWSPVTRRITWSSRTYEIFGIPDGAELGYERYARCFPKEDLARQEAMIAAAMAPDGPRRFRVEHRIRRESDGEERWVIGHALVLTDDEGRVVRMLGTTADATEQVRARRETEEARAALAEAVRAKDEFLAMLGHELRNPLAPIVTALRLMQLRGASHSRERDVIERQVQNLTRLVDDLLDVSRIAAGRVRINPEPLDIAVVIAHAVELASPLIEQRRQRLDVALHPDALRVRGDETRLSQVVCNLLVNAAKYTPEGGRIELRSGREGGDAVLRVRDDGIGISPELLPRVFDLFAQGRQAIDRAQGGMGLGLAIARNLVTIHGGRIEAHSEGEGRGSEFVVRLPLLDDSPNAPAAAPVGGLRAGLRVLLVDDNADAARALADALAAEGAQVVTAPDGPTALSRAETSPPDVALLDLGLPVMDGFELAGLLRARWPRLPLIALSGYGDADDFARTRVAGFAAHLVKPVDLERLLSALRALGGGARV